MTGGISAGFIEDIGLGMAGVLMAGAFGVGFLDEVGLTGYGLSIGGAFLVGEMDVDTPVFTSVDVYGAALCGAFSRGLFFLDRVEQPIYFSDYDAHIGGGLPQGLLGGSAEAQGHV